jgi:putative ABC transport system permease protein
MKDVGTPEILMLWQAAAVLILVIGCTNITSLLLAVGAERRRDFAMRLALGAGRGRLIRQLLGESLLVAAIALPAALGVAVLILRIIRSAMPATIARFVAGWNSMGVDVRVIVFTAALAVATVLLFGVLPALQSSRLSLTSALRDGGRTGSTGRARSRLRRALVVAEIALAVPLLIISTLAAVGAHRFVSGPQGYDPADVYRVRIALPDARYHDAPDQRRFVERLLEEAKAMPGIERVATANVTPSSSSNESRVLAIEGREPRAGDETRVNFRAVSAGYLETMHIPLLQGRGLEESDREHGRRVAVISQSMARSYWPAGSPIDQRVRLGRDARDWTTIVGIVGDTVDDWFDSRRVPTVYVPVSQAPNASVTLVVRSSAGPVALGAAVRAALARVDPDIAPYGEMSMVDVIRERTIGLRFISALMTAFGLLALLLAAFGIYAVMAHHVAQRRQEIGIRMALGAAPESVLWQTLGSSLRLAAIGAGVGLIAAIALARVMESALLGIASASPTLFAAVTATLLVVALTASLVPARRATRIDPMVALRE